MTDDALRRQIGQAAVAAAKALNHVGASALVFIAQPSRGHAPPRAEAPGTIAASPARGTHRRPCLAP